MAELSSVISVEKLPALAPLILSGGFVGGPARDDDPTDHNDVEFEFRWGLDRLLDGLALLHEQRVAAGAEE
jgi:hypothetical protein